MLGLSAEAFLCTNSKSVCIIFGRVGEIVNSKLHFSGRLGQKNFMKP